MSSIVIAPGIEITAKDLFPASTTQAVNEALSGLISQTGGINLLGIGKVVSHFNEYSFTLGNRTFHYLGDFTSTVDQGLLGSVSTVTGRFNHVIVEQAGHTVADLNLDSLVGLNLGSTSAAGLLGLDLGELTGGLLSNLLGNGPSSLLNSLTGTVSTLLGTVQDLIDDETLPVDPTHPTDPTDPTDPTVPTDPTDPLDPLDPDDDLEGEDGDDDLTGLSGNDNIRGLGGNDILHGEGGDDAIFGDDGNDMGYGDTGNDYLSGGAGLDQLWGGDGDDFLFGDAGNDKLYGDAGNDRLTGGTGFDTLDGGAGNDVLIAGKSNDQMTGGLGADTFVFMSAKDSAHRGDLITDFNLQEGDRLDFSHFRHVEFIGRHDMSHQRGEIQVSYKGGDTYIRADFNGDGKGEFVLHLDGHLKLGADDFVM